MQMVRTTLCIALLYRHRARAHSTHARTRTHIHTNFRRILIPITCLSLTIRTPCCLCNLCIWNLQFCGYRLHSFYIKHTLSWIDSSNRYIWTKKR